MIYQLKSYYSKIYFIPRVIYKRKLVCRINIEIITIIKNRTDNFKQQFDLENIKQRLGLNLGHDFLFLIKNVGSP